MNEADARKEICRVGKSLFDRGYVHATAGNISVRLSDGFLITPTDACLGNLSEEDIALVDIRGNQVSGLQASKTLALHLKIYAETELSAPATGCIIHTHSTHCVAITLGEVTGELLPAITPYFVMKVGRVPLIPYHRPGDPASAVSVAETIRRYNASGNPIRAVMMSRLGPNVWHETPAQAMAVLEELEETARLWTMSSIKPSPLSDAEIEKLRSVFKARW